MAPQRWKISDWKNARLAAYRLLVKGATIYRGDGEPIPRDLQLGNLRDTYYEDAYGSLEPLLADAETSGVAPATPTASNHTTTESRVSVRAFRAPRPKRWRA